jgi:eukaryotic-like serine/threonine-protein kinase
MEFLDGETLAARLTRGPLPKAQARAIGRQICAGLAEAHRNRVVHGDLKSSNVILTQDAGGDTRAVITDFGLARRPPGSAASNAPSWVSNSAWSSQAGGTPDYMAPELWKGEKPTTASDVYALGVILSELTSGRRPAGSAKPTGVQHGWDSILGKCLDPDPVKRYLDATEVAPALEPSRALGWWLAATAAVVLAVISALVTFHRATAPKETVRLALLPFEASSDIAPIAAKMSRDASRELGNLKGSSQTGFQVIRPREISRKKVASAQEARVLLGATHVLHGTLARENGDLNLHVYLTDTHSGINTKEWEARYKPAEIQYAPVALISVVTSGLHLPPIRTYASVSAAARKDYMTGLSYVRRSLRPDDSVADLERAVAADPDSAVAYAGLAEAQFYKYYVTHDAAWKAKAQESVRQAELRNSDVAEVHAISGLLELNSSLYVLAKSDYQRAIELQPNNGDAYRRLSGIYYRDAEPDEAFAAIKKAIEVQPTEFRNYQKLGTLYIRQGNYQAALPEFQKMVGLAPNVAETHFAFGAALEYVGRFTDAETEMRSSIRLQDSSDAEHELGTILLDERRDRDAIACFRRALDIGPKTGELWLNLGRASSQEHLASDAKSAFQEGSQRARWL